MKHRTTDELLHGMDLTGLRILITGVSSGIGHETARALAAHGAEVVGTVREGGAENLPNVELVALDLGALQSVRACADELLANGRPFTHIIANAGVMATPFGRTADGFETQFGINHLGHFVLVNRLAPLLADNGRLVVVASNGHRFANVDLADPSFAHTAYDPWVAYGRAKTANILFAVEFDRRHRHRGVRACALMPGVSPTKLARHLSEQELHALGAKLSADRASAGLGPLQFKTLPEAAATSVWGAVIANADVMGGAYLEDCRVAHVDDTPGFRDGVMSYALDPENAKRLWAKSEALVGETFGET